jgi:hypothetical protein
MSLLGRIRGISNPIRSPSFTKGNIPIYTIQPSTPFIPKELDGSIPTFDKISNIRAHQLQLPYIAGPKGNSRRIEPPSIRT